MSWTYRCLNQSCGKTYTVAVNRPRCPKCKGTRARWVPQGIAIRAVATGVDRSSRDLAAQFGLSNFQTARQGEAVKRAPEPARGIPLRPAGGQYGGVKMPVNINGQMGTPDLPYNGAVCSPTGVGSSFRPVGTVNPAQAAAGRQRLQQMTQVVARHRPTE